MIPNISRRPIATAMTLLIAAACTPDRADRNPQTTAQSIQHQNLLRLVEALRTDLPAALADSQAVLLGQRDPNSVSCQIYKGPRETEGGYKPPPKGDPAGGPGNRMLRLYYWDHLDAVKTPTEDFAWHQTVLRRELDAVRDRNHRAAARIDAILVKIDALSAVLPAYPPATSATAASTATNWPVYCLDQFAASVSRKDFVAARWLAELRASLMGLQDIHRWLDLVAGNQLVALDFQKLGESLFAAMDESEERYVSVQAISRFPAGSLCVAALNNYFEIERQAEDHFRKPGKFALAAEKTHPLLQRLPAAVCLTPDVREAFAALREHLPPALQRTWDEAASLPYERSFIVNQLFRAQESRTLDRLAEVLERFGKRHTEATVAQLMDAIVYRAAMGMSGMEWADRYDPRLMEAAATLDAATSEDLFLAARRWAFENVYRNSDNYRTMVLSLRAALDTNKYDCIRGTDMVAALYRNAGGDGFINVRWTRGDNAHTIAGLEVPGPGEKTRIIVIDSLLPPGNVEEWPASYLQPRGAIYGVEINGRGLDNYVLLEAYLVRGPHAGTLMKASIPYLVHHRTAGTERLR